MLPSHGVPGSLVGDPCSRAPSKEAHPARPGPALRPPGDRGVPGRTFAGRPGVLVGRRRAVGDGGLRRRRREPDRRRRDLDRVLQLGPRARPRPRVPGRRLRRADVVRHRRRGGGGVHLRRQLLRPRAACDPDGGQPPRLRRGDGRARRLRQRAAALPLLGADLGHLVPPHRHQGRGGRRSLRRPARPPRDRRRWPGHARWAGPGRAVRRELRPERVGGLTPERDGGQCGRRPDPARRADQVGAGALPQLATRRHGGPDADQRVPALGHDGEGGRVPRGPAGAGLRHPRGVAVDGPRSRRGVGPARGLSGAAPARSQARAGLRHHQPARLVDGAVRRRNRGDHAGRLRAARGPRRVQGFALPDRGGDRPPDPHP